MDDEKYLTIKYKGLTFQAKMEDEGIVLDVFEKGDSVSTGYKFYDEFDVEVNHLEFCPRCIEDWENPDTGEIDKGTKEKSECPECGICEECEHLLECSKAK